MMMLMRGETQNKCVCVAERRTHRGFCCLWVCEYLCVSAIRGERSERAAASEWANDNRVLRTMTGYEILCVVNWNQYYVPGCNEWQQNFRFVVVSRVRNSLPFCWNNNCRRLSRACVCVCIDVFVCMLVVYRFFLLIFLFPIKNYYHHQAVAAQLPFFKVNKIYKSKKRKTNYRNIYLYKNNYNY